MLYYVMLWKLSFIFRFWIIYRLCRNDKNNWYIKVVFFIPLTFRANVTGLIFSVHYRISILLYLHCGWRSVTSLFFIYCTDSHLISVESFKLWLRVFMLLLSYIYTQYNIYLGEKNINIIGTIFETKPVIFLFYNDAFFILVSTVIVFI